MLNSVKPNCFSFLFFLLFYENIAKVIYIVIYVIGFGIKKKKHKHFLHSVNIPWLSDRSLFFRRLPQRGDCIQVEKELCGGWGYSLMEALPVLLCGPEEHLWDCQDRLWYESTFIYLFSFLLNSTCLLYSVMVEAASTVLQLLYHVVEQQRELTSCCLTRRPCREWYIYMCRALMCCCAAA